MLRRDFQTIDQPTREKIVGLVHANPRISVHELAETLGIKSASNIHYHIRRLEAKGLIEMVVQKAISDQRLALSEDADSN
jgi:predicted transcriptional regulator